MKRRRHRKKDWDKHFYIQACSYIHASHNCDFTHIFFTAPTLLHTIAFTHQHCYTQTLLHADAFTQTLLHRDSFTHKHFKRRRFYVQSLLHASTFTHKHYLYAQTLYQNQPNPQKKGLTLKHHFVRKGCRRGCKIAILPQLLTLELHFERQGCRGGCKIAILRQFLTIEHYFVAPRRHRPRPKERREKEGERPCEREREEEREWRCEDEKMWCEHIWRCIADLHY